MNPKCPYLVERACFSKEYDEYFSDSICDLTDKYCLVEYGSNCETYNEYLKEMSIEQS